MIPIKKIVLPTDFSEPSYAAIEPALELAEHFSARIFVVHVVAPVPIIPGTTAPPAVDIPEMLNEIKRSSEKAIEELIKERLTGVEAGYYVVQGKPAEEIISVAAKESADLIVISTHGESGLQRLVAGSVAEKVARLADCPVLTVRAHPEK